MNGVCVIVLTDLFSILLEPLPPPSATAESVSPTSIHVCWEIPHIATKYNITIEFERATGHLQVGACKDHVHNDGIVITDYGADYTLTGLEEYSTYIITIVIYVADTDPIRLTVNATTGTARKY